MTLAREKNTARAEARRRSREQMRAQLADEHDEAVEDVPSDEQPPPERKSLFKMPNIGQDVRDLPAILTSRRLVLLPLLLLLIGLALTLVYPGLSPDLQVFAGYYLQFFFVPPALFTFFLAGFFAPRASYLVGALYGLIAGVMWTFAFGGFVAPTTPPTDPALPPADPGGTAVIALFYGLIYGTLAAALAAWYRDFLRGIQERGRARRAEREVQERAKRREQRQEARRVAKHRPTT